MAEIDNQWRFGIALLPNRIADVITSGAMIQVKYEGKTLVDSKAFVTLGLGVTEVKLDVGTGALTVLLDFRQTDDEAVTLVREVVDQTTLRLVLNNWNNPLGLFLVEPAEIARFQNRRLYLVLSVTKNSTASQQRSVLMSFYLDDNV